MSTGISITRNNPSRRLFLRLSALFATHYWWLPGKTLFLRKLEQDLFNGNS